MNCFLLQGPWKGIMVLSKTMVNLAVIFVFYLKRSELNSSIHKVWLTKKNLQKSRSPAPKLDQEVAPSTFSVIWLKDVIPMQLKQATEFVESLVLFSKPCIFKLL